MHCHKDGMLYSQYGWLCVWLLCRLYCSNAIVSVNCYTAFVPKCGRRNAEVRVVEHGRRYRRAVTSVPKNKVTLH